MYFEALKVNLSLLILALAIFVCKYVISLVSALRHFSLRRFKRLHFSVGALSLANEIETELFKF